MEIPVWSLLAIPLTAIATYVVSRSLASAARAALLRTERLSAAATAVKALGALTEYVKTRRIANRQLEQDVVAELVAAQATTFKDALAGISDMRGYDDFQARYSDALAAADDIDTAAIGEQFENARARWNAANLNLHAALNRMEDDAV